MSSRGSLHSGLRIAALLEGSAVPLVIVVWAPSCLLVVTPLGGSQACLPLGVPGWCWMEVDLESGRETTERQRNPQEEVTGEAGTQPRPGSNLGCTTSCQGSCGQAPSTPGFCFLVS